MNDTMIGKRRPLPSSPKTTNRTQHCRYRFLLCLVVLATGRCQEAPLIGGGALSDAVHVLPVGQLDQASATIDGGLRSRDPGLPQDDGATERRLGKGRYENHYEASSRVGASPSPTPVVAVAIEPTPSPTHTMEKPSLQETTHQEPLQNNTSSKVSLELSVAVMTGDDDDMTTNETYYADTLNAIINALNTVIVNDTAYDLQERRFGVHC